jgi:MFS family permease
MGTCSAGTSQCCLGGCKNYLNFYVEDAYPFSFLDTANLCGGYIQLGRIWRWNDISSHNGHSYSPAFFWYALFTLNLLRKVKCPANMSGYLSDRFGTRIVATIGFVLLTPSLICMRLVHSNTVEQKILLCVLLALFGIFNNGTSPCLFAEGQHVLDDMEEQNPGLFGKKGATAQAFGLQQMAQFTGLALGPMLGGFIDGNFGWEVMTLWLGILSAITALLIFWLLVSETEEDSTKANLEEEPLLAASGLPVPPGLSERDI